MGRKKFHPMGWDGCENALLYHEQKTQPEKGKEREHQNNEGKRISLTQTNSIHIYSLPYIAFNPLLLRMRCMEEEQWRRQRGDVRK